MIPHPLYDNTRNSTYLQNDIAILRMETPIVLDDDQGVIDLPSSDYGNRPFCPDADVLAAGWGYTTRHRKEDDGTELPTQLLQAQMKVISHPTCQKIWPKMTITDDMFCIDSSATDICQGDSGGPVFENYWSTTEGVEKQRLLGIVSASSTGCGAQDGASIITNVAKYMDDFIQPIIAASSAIG